MYSNTYEALCIHIISYYIKLYLYYIIKYYVYYWYIILCSNTWYIYIYTHIYRHIYVYILLLRLLTSSEICWARRTDTFLSMHSDDGLGMLWRALCSTTAWSWVTWLTWKKKKLTLWVFYIKLDSNICTLLINIPLKCFLSTFTHKPLHPANMSSR